MFVDARTVSDETLRFDYWFREISAVDAETGAELTRSSARRRVGRPAHWYVRVPDGRYCSTTNAAQPQEHLEECWSQIFGLSAYSLAEAMEKANQRMQRWLKRVTSFLDCLPGEATAFGEIVVCPACHSLSISVSGEVTYLLDTTGRMADWTSGVAWTYTQYIHRMVGPSDGGDVAAFRYFPLQKCLVGAQMTPAYRLKKGIHDA